MKVRGLIFLFLQWTGAGSRTSCKPSVAESFEWNRKHVASLAKSGSLIYIQALGTFPFLQVSSLLCSCICKYALRMYIRTLAMECISHHLLVNPYFFCHTAKILNQLHVEKVGILPSKL